ncbi:esterase-like activity of phytase family protein [Rhizobium gallicum]|uniref:esterase-like activity of phytase family protein n=1 Tax=Rhizobium gallicum TaxID=56730 RepID=UPI001EF78159|nr:esterase-like activity of phytase family protein [Rhizobium gallicum]ULJ71820.1 esterase-like activity of phytase family protein [Rhizobium gallicum]
MIRLSRSALLVLCLAGDASIAVARESVDISSRVISTFKIGSSETRFGPLEFLGGLEMVSGNRLFGSWSAIRFVPDRRHFVGVLDTGHWLTGSIERDQQGRLSGLSGVEITPMKNGSGATFEGKGRMDAEGLALKGDQVLVSFEQDHRVEAYPDPGFETSSSVGSIPILVPIRSLRSGRGFETLAVAPPESALKGAAVIISEESRDQKGNIYGAILSGPLKGRFAVTRNGDFDPTDGAFLPDGDLLLLERRFNIANGIAMRIRRIAAAEIRPDAVADGDILLTADFGYQIDNMEGLDSFQAPDGSTHVIIVSDDNHSILERNLMLEFRLTE